MSIRAKAGWVRGTFADWLGDTRANMAIAVQSGVSTATTELRDALRNQVADAGLGDKLGNAVGANVYPRGGKPSLGAAGYVYPRGRKATAIFDSFNSASVITAKKGKYLAIPTQAAGKSGRYTKVTPQTFEKQTGIKLEFARSRKGTALLVGKKFKSKLMRGALGGERNSQIYFILIPVAHMPKRLGFEALAQTWADNIPALIDAASKGGDT